MMDLCGRVKREAFGLVFWPEGVEQTAESLYYWALLELSGMHNLSCTTDAWWLMPTVNISWHFKASTMLCCDRHQARCVKITKFALLENVTGCVLVLIWVTNECNQ